MIGKFITFEGCEGAGKTTQLNLLKEFLDNQKIDYIFAREPGGTNISEKIRNIILDGANSNECPECEALLYAAARVQLLKEVIMPALEKGKTVILDRYIDSSFAYQAYARDLGFDFIEKINSFAITNCMPNVTIFLDIEPNKAFLRKGGADANDRIEMEGIAFHKKVYDGYQKLIKKYPNRFTPVDCSGEAEQTHNLIVKTLREKGII